MPMLARLLPALFLALCLPAHANWHLDGESSRLSFVTGKNGEITEVHRFLVLHGKVDDKGLAEVEVELNRSVPASPSVTSDCVIKCFR